MRSERPQTVSVCLVKAQLDVLNQIGDELAERAEPASRSGLVRQALNIGLAALADRLRKRGPGSGNEGQEGSGQVPVGTAA